MNNISKQFAPWAINFRNNPFLRARLKLTAYYTAGVCIILIIFSLAVYGLFVKNITSNFEYDGPGFENEANVETQIIDKAQDQLQTILITIDAMIVLLIAGFSYYLAGKTLQPIESSYMRQKKFVADAAHELRTPLTVMKTGAEAVLSGDNSKEEYKKIVRDSLEEINYLSAMVDDLLFLAKSDNSRKTEFSSFNFSGLIHRQIELMRPCAEKKSIAVASEVQEELYMNGNKACLKRLLANLIKNAIDHNKPHGKITVSLKKNKNLTVLKIADTGIGIAESDLKHVFDRFYKAEHSHAKQSGGAGLGLSIAQEIVKLHRGTIDIKSKLNQGTEVVISLPVGLDFHEKNPA